eukprot:768807-Hanusia_phi.AAC.5
MVPTVAEQPTCRLWWWLSRSAAGSDGMAGDQSADLEERKRLASTGMGVRKAPSQLESRRQTPSAELYDEDYQRVDNRPAQSRASSCRPPPPWNGEQPANVREVPPYVSRIDPYREAASSSASGYGDSHATDRHRQTSLTACMQECDTLMVRTLSCVQPALSFQDHLLFAHFLIFIPLLKLLSPLFHNFSPPLLSLTME